MVLLWMLLRKFLVYRIAQVRILKTNARKKTPEILHTTEIVAITRRREIIILFLYMPISSFAIPEAAVQRCS